MTERKRDYKKEYRDFQGTPLQKKRRAERNAARRTMEKAGKVHKGDAREVDHISRNLSGRLSNSPSNLRVVSRKANRSRNSHKGK